MGRKELNPADVYRKQQRKKELKKCKETRNVVRSVQELLSDPNKIEEEIQKAQKASDASALDKGLKDRIKELKMMKTVAVTKQKIDMASGKTDRDAAAAVREAEMLERDRQRDRRRGLRPEDSQMNNRADDGDPLESYRNKDQESSSSSNRPIAAPALIEQSGFIQQQSQQQVSVQPQIFQPQSVLPQQVAPTLFGIAPMLSFPSDSVPPPPPSFRPPPPMPPGLQLRVPPPIFTPPALEGASSSATGILSQTVPPPPPPPIFPKPSPDVFEQSEEELEKSAASAHSDTEEDLGPRRFHVEDSSEEKEQQIEVPVTAFPFSFSSSDFKLPSAEELMRRRHAVSDETDILTVENSAARYDVSYPKPESIRAEQEKEQESDSESKFATEEIIREKSENIFFPKTRTIYIPPSVPVLGTVPPKMSGGLGGLADYGSDSDDDDDNDDNDGGAVRKDESVIKEVPRFIPMALPSEFRSYESVTSAPIRTSHQDHSEEPSPPAAASTEHSVPVGSSDSQSHSVADDVTAFLDSIATNTLSLSTVPPPKQSDQNQNQNQNPPRPTPIVGIKVQVPSKAPLKSIRPDFALTAFIPNALRMKRPAAPMGKTAAKIPKIESNASNSGSSNSSFNVGGDVKRAELVGGVDDAYLTFLDEIGELTG